MSSGATNRRKRKAPQAGELLERWKSGDTDAESMLLENGPADIIPLLRTPDEMEYLRGPVPPLTPLNASCAAACLNVFLIPFSLGLGAAFKSSIPLIVLLSAEAVVIAGVYWNRVKLKEAAVRFARKQLRHAEL